MARPFGFQIAEAVADALRDAGIVYVEFAAQIEELSVEFAGPVDDILEIALAGFYDVGFLVGDFF